MITLGALYGKLAVADLTLDEVREALNKHLRQFVTNPRFSVTLGGWEKDWQRFEGEDGRQPVADEEGLRYGGKTFEQWRATLMTDLKPEIRIEGIKALSALGARGRGVEAMRAILEVMTGYDRTLGFKDDAAVFDAGVEASVKIGPPAVSVLVAALKDANRNARLFAAAALRRTRAREAVPALIEAFKDPEAGIRKEAIQAVWAIDPKTKGFVPALQGVLKDEDSSIRTLALRIVKASGPRAQVAVPILIDALKDEDPEIRKLAAEALGAIGPGARSAAPALIEALNDTHLQVSSAAVGALVEVQPEAKVVLPGLLDALKRTNNPTVQSSAYELLRRLGPDAKQAVPYLIKALQDPSTQYGAVSVLESIGPAAREAVPALDQLQGTTPDLGLHDAVRKALQKIDPEREK